ncbi:MAG: YggN family protein [Gammaproteobacteria bacterium]|nr:YggN family protein [Gammaproteobacteria bacterium]
MKKMTLIAGALSLALMCVPTQASNDEMCDYRLDYDLTVEDASITFVQDSGKKITINKNNQLYVNGSEKSINGEQQILIDNYADGIRDLIPEITAIALEGINLGVQAASMAIGTLLGEGDPDFKSFSFKINEFADNIKMKFETDNFSSKRLKYAFENEFEQQIESIVEDAVIELTPRLMAKVMTAALSGDEGGISDLEMRAESIEHDVESFVEPKVEALEARAVELCGSVDNLDTLETKMVDSGLEMMNLIKKGNGENGYKSKGKYFNFNLGE